MKNLIQFLLVFLTLLLVNFSLIAQEKRADYYKVPDKLINHLQALNSQWLKYENIQRLDNELLSTSVYFEKHEDLIQTHLQLVEKTLRKKNAQYLTSVQVEKRNAALDVLKNYWQTGIFPKNTKHTKLTPYFIDDFNTACAVGHIMRETDAQELAATIAQTCNYAYISDMPFQKEMATWAYNAGFSVEELKWIQPAYGPQLIFVPAVNKPSCGAADGSLEINVTAGDWYWGQTPVEELMYLWDNGMEGTILHNIESGVYCVSVFDVPPPPDPSIGSDPVLLMEQCFTVDNSSAANFTGEVTHETCPEALNGSIELSISGNNHIIKWYNNQWQELEGENSNTLSGLEGFPINGIIFDGISENIFHVEVTSGIGCKAYQSFGVSTLSDAPYIFISNSTIEEAACGSANGYAEVWFDPGVSLLWSDGSTNAIRNDLAAGNYTITATNQVGCTYELNFEMTEECPNQECNTSWFEPNDFSCGLQEYITEDGQYIYQTIISDMVADAPSNFYDCEGNYLCYSGGFPLPEPQSGECSLYEGINFSNITFVRNVVECPNFNCFNTAWINDLNTCGLDKYITAAGATIYATTNDPMIADAPTIYYDCEGNFLCESGGFYPIPLPATVCSENNAVDLNSLTFVETIIPCIGINPFLCNTNWFEPTDFACSLKEYVTANGATIFEVAPSPFIADLPTEYYDCEGNLLCISGGYYPEDYFPPNECAVNNAVNIAGLTYVQTINICPNIFCNTNWFEPNEMECSLTEYVTPDGTTIFKTESSYIVADGTSNYYDCEGNLLCYTGGFASINTCESIFDVSKLAFVQQVVNCSQSCGILDLSWAEELINNDCICRVDLYQNNFGEYIVLADSDCNFIDDADSYYDCQGNWLCATNGELMPESYCSNSFLENLTFIENLYTCDYNFSCNGIAKYSIKIRVLLEGNFDGFGMGTNLFDAQILPLSQPYNTAPYNYSGGEQFLNNISNVVDWIMVCLRDAEGNLIDKQAAFINADGDLVNASGGECLVFPEANVFGSYYVSVHHRGHLSVMSSVAISDEMYYDFTTGLDKAMGVEPMKNVNGNFVMFGGDYDNNGIINNLDFNNWYNNAAAVNQYLEIDIDGNGIVNNLDYNVWELNRSKIGLPNFDNNMGN